MLASCLGCRIYPSSLAAGGRILLTLTKCGKKKNKTKKYLVSSWPGHWVNGRPFLTQTYWSISIPDLSKQGPFTGKKKKKTGNKKIFHVAARAFLFFFFPFFFYEDEVF